MAKILKPDEEEVARQTFRTGTWQFISGVRLLDPKKRHEFSDDLESFVHVLMYHLCDIALQELLAWATGFIRFIMILGRALKVRTKVAKARSNGSLALFSRWMSGVRSSQRPVPTLLRVSSHSLKSSTFRQNISLSSCRMARQTLPVGASKMPLQP
ncbi:hypothetical protein FA95DRAFT_168757 [Auriscalpium vulgare]|uniref:Uncharacterized protein n=1 Tax=Auriscalpium vulgare TaxID=40419 RepID=A0ACB8R0E6_9AGAM|nr:hypothetical protein FA95DRAFT_168757 [Auriscalpium vulgare]